MRYIPALPAGMERVERTNLLLSIANPKQVYERLLEHTARPSSGHSPTPDPPAPDPVHLKSGPATERRWTWRSPNAARTT